MNDWKPSPSQRLRHAVPATFFVFTVKTAFAYCIVIPIIEILDAAFVRLMASPSSSFEVTNWALILEAVRLTWLSFKGQIAFYLVISAVYMFISPLLSMAWLCVLSRPVALRIALLEAARRYHRCILVLGLYLTGLSLVAILVGGLSLLIWLSPVFPNNDRAQDLIAIAPLLPGAILLIFLYMIHDASMAVLVDNEVRLPRAILRSYRLINRCSRVFAFSGWHTCVLLLSLAGFMMVSALGTNSALNATAALFLSQLLVLARTAIRGRWLASLIS
jgi:hypothetical protein